MDTKRHEFPQKKLSTTTDIFIQGDSNRNRAALEGLLALGFELKRIGKPLFDMKMPIWLSIIRITQPGRRRELFADLPGTGAGYLTSTVRCWLLQEV